MENNNENQTYGPQGNNGYQQQNPNQGYYQQPNQQMNQGYYQQSNYQPQAKKTNALGLASFICALVGIFFAGLPLGIAAMITGIIGCTKFNPETETNKWMAVVGIILGVIDVICVIFFLIFASEVAGGIIRSLT